MSIDLRRLLLLLAFEAMDKLDCGQGNFFTAAASSRGMLHVYTDPYMCDLWAAAKFAGGGLSAASEHSIFPADIVALCDANFVQALSVALRNCDAPI